MDASTSLWRQHPGLLGEKVLMIRRQSLACTSDLVEFSKVRASDFTKLCSPLTHPLVYYQGLEIKWPKIWTSVNSLWGHKLFSLFILMSCSSVVKDSSSCPWPSRLHCCWDPGHTNRPYWPWLAFIGSPKMVGHLHVLTGCSLSYVTGWAWP